MPTPAALYTRLNKLLWLGRLPKATVSFADDEMIPTCYGITLFDRNFAQPVIFINKTQKKWARTMIHEMCHVAEPNLNHGVLFDALVETYWRIAKERIKGLGDI